MRQALTPPVLSPVTSGARGERRESQRPSAGEDMLAPWAAAAEVWDVAGSIEFDRKVQV